jgi:hypothetical protein
MVGRVTRVSFVVALVTFGPTALASFAQQSQPDPAVKVVQVKGLPGIKENTKGKLTVEGGTLHFVHETTKSDLATVSMEDVVTGADSQRVIHGTLGTLTMLAPYGSGRFLSLFRTKLDTLTIEYRDADGGLHGAIFAMPVGKAEMIKKDLIAQGAHTTIAPETATVAPGKESVAKGEKQ